MPRAAWMMPIFEYPSMTIAPLMIARCEHQREEQAARLPRQLLQHLSEEDGEAGLTLTREHMATLNAYCAHVKTIPLDTPQLIQWLGYSVHSEVELAVVLMQQMFDNLHLHADTWVPLQRCCSALPGELRSCARAMQDAGEQALAACEATKALGGRGASWQFVQFAPPVSLSLEDKARVTDLSGWLGVMRVECERFYRRVSVVREGVEQFRDEARFRYQPQLGRKVDAIKRTQNSPPIVQMRASLQRIDARIQALDLDYAQRLTAGPALLGVIYGIQLRTLRKERNQLLESRRYLSEELQSRGATEGRLEALASRLEQLIAQTRDVTTSASHLQTAWQLIGVYLDTCIERVGMMQNSQQLARFVIHFKNFLEQWAFIEQCAVALQKRLPPH